MLKEFFNRESGATLVEYAVALIVVTLVGGSGTIAVGTNAGIIASGADQVVDNAVDQLP